MGIDFHKSDTIQKTIVQIDVTPKVRLTFNKLNYLDEKGLWKDKF